MDSMERTLGDRSIEEPVMRTWELNENSTRYDWSVAAPSDDTLVTSWWVIGSVSTFVVLVTAVVATAILHKAKTRRTAFNQYLIGIIIPDFVMSFVCAIVCFMSAAAGHFYSAALCRAQTWFLVFGTAGNTWMSVVILRELLRLLSSAKQLKRYSSPTPFVVTKQCGIALLWASIVASWGLFPESWKIPHRTMPKSGYVCLPVDYDLASSLFFFLVYFAALCGVPICYAIYAMIKIKREQLMPKQGQRKLIAMYLLRIILLLFVWWLPSLFFLFVYSQVPYWLTMFMAVWAHIQGAASAFMMLGKPDVRRAVVDLLLCRACRQQPSPEEETKGQTKGQTKVPRKSSTLTTDEEGGTSGNDAAVRSSQKMSFGWGRKTILHRATSLEQPVAVDLPILEEDIASGAGGSAEDESAPESTTIDHRQHNLGFGWDDAADDEFNENGQQGTV
ncbi:hypothetical protein ACHAXT_009223 [Thalassiosira profunda]